MSKLDKELEKINIKLSKLINEKKKVEALIKGESEEELYLYGEDMVNDEGAPLI